MGDVLLSIWTLIVYMAIGFALVKLSVLGPQADRGLSKIVFYVTMPMLLLRTVGTADVADVFSLGLLANVLTALIVLATYYVLAVRVFRLTGGMQTIGALASSYTNAGNVGVAFLIATVGTPTAAAGIIVFQVLVLVPFAFLMLDRQTVVDAGPRWKLLVSSFTQPPLVAVFAGLLLNLSAWDVPELITVPVDALANTTVPLMMVALGVSLASAKILRLNRDNLPLFTAIAFRILVSPIITFVIASILGLEGSMLLAAMVVSIFPTANNLFAIAHRYEVGVAFTRDVSVITALGSMPALIVIAAIFHV